MDMRENFLRIKALGVVSDSWLITNRGDVVHSQITGSVNRKMLAEISSRVLQLLVLQAQYIGPDTDYVMLCSDESTVLGFDLGPLVLITISANDVGVERVFAELNQIAGDFKDDQKLIAKYVRKGIERREMIAENRLDDKARGLLQELRKATF